MYLVGYLCGSLVFLVGWLVGCLFVGWLVVWLFVRRLVGCLVVCS